jgi:hypothetical protein
MAQVYPYEAIKDERYLLRALATGYYLRSIVSKLESSRYLIFHDDAGGRDLFYLGWCHGPAGTGRFFYRLSQLTNDPGCLTLVRNQATTLMASGIPSDKGRDTGTTLADAVERPERTNFSSACLRQPRTEATSRLPSTSRPI